MPDKTLRKACCSSGALRTETYDLPHRTMLCSCASSQARTGSALDISAHWPAEHVQIPGLSTQRQRTCQADREAEHHFCSNCGTTLWWHADFAPGLIGIARSTFEDAHFLEPTIACWDSERPHWLANINTIKTLEQQST